MKSRQYGIALAAMLAALPAWSGDVDKGAVVGGAVGGGAGAAIGSKIGGTAGAAIGGAIGGAAGAAVGSSGSSQPAERVVVKERVIVKEVTVAGDGDDHPPGHGRGKKKGWKKHKHD